MSATPTGDSIDILVVGGGVMGSSVAYHLLSMDPGLTVVVIERDPTYARASSALSVGNIRVQFTLAPNVAISRYALEVLATFDRDMEVDGMSPDVQFRREGNLFLVGAAGEEKAREAVARQRRNGARVEWWNRERVAAELPLYQLRGLVGGSYGPDDGHLDGYAMVMGYRRKAVALGATYLRSEASGLLTGGRSVRGVRLADGGSLASAVVVNCAGAWAADLAASVGVDLPVVPTRRQVFTAEPEAVPERALPLTGLPSGLYLRTEPNGRVLVGRSLPDDPVGFDFRVEQRRFEDVLWPELVELVPVFDRLRSIRGWAGLYAVNTLDGNALLGAWPELDGLFLVNGFSGHGLQQAPAAGRYLAELLLGRSPSLDLSMFSPRRVLEARPLREDALV